MSEYIKNIYSNSQSNTIGGKAFDGQWVDVYYELCYGVTFAANKATTYSLAGKIPNDGYVYECQFDCYIRTGTSSGNTAACILYSGTGIDGDTQIYVDMATVRTRTSSNRAGGGYGVLPVFPDDQNVTYYNAGSGTSGNCGLYLRRYRRVGTNE